MSGGRHPTLFAGARDRLLITAPDVPDIRDYIYTPTLAPLPERLDPRTDEGAAGWWNPAYFRDQGEEPDCTAQALAGIIDRLRARDLAARGDAGDAPRKKRGKKGRAKAPDIRTSAAMLYQLARMHDRWPGENYTGSSIRAVLKGFYYNGACESAVYSAAVGDEVDLRNDPVMNREILTSTRNIRLGSYFRVRPRLSDLHAALHEAGFVLASAVVHDGWQAPSPVRRRGLSCADLPYDPKMASLADRQGRHAFIVIGYDDKGFLIQNSWGETWGAGGIAHWSYRDWAVNAVDHWVLRLAAPLHPDMADGPQIAVSRASALKQRQFETGRAAYLPSPSRLDVLGHVVPLSRGRLDEFGHYHVNRRTLRTTVAIIAQQKRKYRHILIHVMGLQQDEDLAVAALRDTLEVFKANGVYPIFVMPERALASELCTLCEQAVADANRVHGDAASPEKDRRIAGAISQAATRILEQVERSLFETICQPASDGTLCDGDGIALLSALFGEMEDGYRGGTLSYHVSAHGFGAVLLAAILRNADRFNTPPAIATATLFSPMLSLRAFRELVAERVEFREDCPVHRRGTLNRLTVEAMKVWLLDAECERIDRPFPGCDLSWPALWAQARALAAPMGEGDAQGDRDPARDATLRDIDRPFRSPGEVRYMALARHAMTLRECPDIRSRDIEVTALAADGRASAPMDGSGEDDPATDPPFARDPMRHRDMDLRICMLDRLLDAMIGPDKASPSFSQFFARRDSLLLD